MAFKPGQSGNPKGRPIGSKDKRSEFRGLLQSNADKLVKKAVEMALNGDSTAMRLCLERIVPPYKARAENTSIGPLNGSLTAQGQAIIEKMGNGDISPDETAAMLQALAAQAKITEIDDLEKRISKLEERS